MIEEHRAAMEEFTLANIQEQRMPEGSLAKSIRRAHASNANQPISLEQQQSLVDAVLAMAVGTMLARRGWKIFTQPGCGFTLVKDGNEIELFDTVQKLTQGDLSENQWLAYWQARGIDTQLRVVES